MEKKPELKGVIQTASESRQKLGEIEGCTFEPSVKDRIYTQALHRKEFFKPDL